METLKLYTLEEGCVLTGHKTLVEYIRNNMPEQMFCTEEEWQAKKESELVYTDLNLPYSNLPSTV